MNNSKVRAKVIFLLVLISILLLLLPTESVDAKSVNEQICIQSTMGKNTNLTAGIISELQVNLNEIEINVQEQNNDIVALENYEFVSGWTNTDVNIRQESDINSEVLDTYFLNTEIQYADYNDEWVIITYEDSYGFIFKKYVSGEEEVYNGPVLNPYDGVVYGPSGKETYYNLPMGKVVEYMRELGYNYDYWVRSDGVKMYGDYVIVAANLSTRPKGTLVPTSLGMGIVCDTGDFAKTNSCQLDIATSW